MASRRVDRVSIRYVDGAMPSPVSSSQALFSRRRAVLLEIWDAEGTRGQGELAPLPGYSPDSLEEGVEALRRFDFGAAEGLARSSTLRHDVVQVLSSISAAVPSARFCVETALLDWLGRCAGLPVTELLGGARASAVSLATWVPGPGRELARQAARGMGTGGTPTFKFKIGRPGCLEDELAGAECIRARYGQKARIRFDANGAFGEDRLDWLLQRLAPFDPEFVEEPVDFGSEVPKVDAPVCIALDESLARRRVDFVRRAFETSAVRFVVLKPVLLGGLFCALSWAEEAHRVGVVALVSHTLDGPVGHAAASQLALCLPPLGYAAGLGLHPGLAVWPPSDLPHVGSGGLKATPRPGLGLTFETEVGLGEPIYL